MSGQPRFQALRKQIELAGGDEWVFERLAEGISVGKVGAMLGASRLLMYKWRDEGGEERKKGWADAMRMSAEAHAEKAGAAVGEDLEGRIVTPADVSLAKARSEYAQWMATVRDRTTFGKEQQQGGLVLNIQNLHIDALRRIPRAAELTQLAPVVEAELVEEGAE